MTLLYLYLPAFVANAVPVLIRWVPGFTQWNTPLDKKLFGAHKTYRGLIMGMLFAVLTGAIQFYVDQSALFTRFHALHPTLPRALLMGGLLGMGALGGDLVKSFCKRKIGIAPGKPWLPGDGVDYIIGAMIVLSPVFLPSLKGILFLLIAAPLLSLLANTTSYLLGWKETWH